ncbi:MAG: hypothetical protein ACR2O0_09890 [Rhizobiaceae bacterium]
MNQDSRKTAKHGSQGKRAGAPDREQEKEAQRILDRVDRDSETIGTSSFARNVDRLGKHFSGMENPEDDEIEIWGKRIARIMALIVFIGLFIHVMNTYIIK